jgi:hypothetical protein
MFTVDNHKLTISRRRYVFEIPHAAGVGTFESIYRETFPKHKMYEFLDIRQLCADLYRRLLISIYGEAVLLFPQHPLILPH